MVRIGLIFILLICVGVISSLTTPLLFAQTFELSVPSPTVGKAPLTIEMFPRYAKPGEYVEFSLVSSSVSISTATVTWTINGTRVFSGPSAIKYVYKIPHSNDPFVVVADVYTRTNQYFTTRYAVQPASLTLLYEGATYVPPLYKGRPVLSPEASLSVQAVPSLIEKGVELQPEDLYFKWTVNGKLVSDLSGLGKSSGIVKNTGLLRPLDIIVEASSDGGTIAGERIKVDVKYPWISLYENDPLLGIRYDKALSDYDLKNEEVTVLAEPYYFGATKRNDANLVYSWGINQQRQAETETASITLRPQAEGGGGASSVGVSIRNTLFELQNAAQSFRINLVR